MHRKSSVRRVSTPTPLQMNSMSGSTTKSPNHDPRFESSKNVDDDHYDNTDVVPRRESLHQPTWQYIVPGQPLPNSNATISSNAESKSLNVTSDSDEDEYLRRPSIVVHHHYYQEKEIQQQLQLPTKPLQQLRRASMHSGVCFKSSSNNGSKKITRHHTIASADVKMAVGSGLPLQRKSSLTHPTRSLFVMQNDSESAGGIMPTTSSTNATITTANSPMTNMDGVTFCKNAGRALMRMVSIGTKPNINGTKSANSVSAYTDGGEECDMMGKVIMLGDSGVGKTCVLIRFYDGKYMPNYYITTVGIDFRNKVVVVDGTRVKLQIWDTAGQERFRSVTHAYYRDAHALLLLYDVTNKTTYDNIRAWLGEIREYAQDDVVIVLIGNKADCSNSERQVKREDGERLAREHNVPFMETSAKTGLNVELAFSAVARQLKCRGTVNGDDGKFNVHDFVRDNTRARTMCAQCKSM
ncbi:ras-related protein Rab-26 isoform X1 [Anastrepha ludens]|uniref:ras-related protein Rab-26 isoform X1 n=1 Tax=Anastrepha ludens TaxID=28586 RepID=UPI0023B137C2|nr:ras-related protein Rab-26 isoform X1 [Anastrepha ludens]